MASSVYQINKSINKPVEFKGLKAQYIWWLGGGLLVLLIVFAIMYIAGLNAFMCLAVILILGTVLFIQVYKLSRRYGQYGMMKMFARGHIPSVIKSRTRKVFVGLQK